MTTHAHFLRQLLLVLRLQHLKRAVPFGELRHYLLEQTSLGDLAANYSQRTFQRDLPKIAERFGVTIAHDRRAGGYVIATADPLPEGYQRLLDAFELQEFLRLPTALSPFVQWEPRRPLGTEWLQPLLRAVQLRRQVAFYYRKFWDEASSARTVSPLLLKEFKGRWYLLAHDPARHGLRCFGLDRIRALELTTRSFEPPADFQADTYYAHSARPRAPSRNSSDTGTDPGAIPEIVPASCFPTRVGRYSRGTADSTHRVQYARPVDGTALAR